MIVHQHNQQQVSSNPSWMKLFFVFVFEEAKLTH